MKNEARKILKTLVNEVITEMKKSGKLIGYKKGVDEKMKKVAAKVGGNTEMKATSTKSITPAIQTKPASESKKRPVKEDLVKMIREELEAFRSTPQAGAKSPRFREFISGFAKAIDCDYPEAETAWETFSQTLPAGERERAERDGQDGGAEFGNKYRSEALKEYRTKGALGKNNPNRTQPVKQQAAAGIPGMGRPAAEAITSVVVNVDGETVGEFELNATLPSGKPDMTPLAKRFTKFIYDNPDMAAYGISPQAMAAVEAASDLEVDDKLDQRNRILNLRVVNGDLTA